MNIVVGRQTFLTLCLILPFTFVILRHPSINTLSHCHLLSTPFICSDIGFEFYMTFRFYMISHFSPASILYEHQVLYNIELCTSFRCDKVLNFTRVSNDMYHGISLDLQVTLGNLQQENTISTIQLCSLSFCEMFLMAC